MSLIASIVQCFHRSQAIKMIKGLEHVTYKDRMRLLSLAKAQRDLTHVHKYLMGQVKMAELAASQWC